MLEISKISITCDFWTDRSSKSHLCITGHYVTREFGYEYSVLSFEAFYDRHQGVRIANIIREKLHHLNLYGKLQCITTDGAANMRTMCENLSDISYDWIWCVAHRYHLVIVNSLGFWSEKKKKKQKKESRNIDKENHTNENDNVDENNNVNTEEKNYNDNYRNNETGIGNHDDGEASQPFWDDAAEGKNKVLLMYWREE